MVADGPKPDRLVLNTESLADVIRLIHLQAYSSRQSEPNKVEKADVDTLCSL